MANRALLGQSHRSRFDGVFDEHFPAVRAYAARRTGADLVDDVVSETFLVAWRRLDAVPSDALPWLLAVARRVLANHRRGESRRAALVERLGGLLPVDHHRDPGEVGLGAGPLGDALRALSPREREAVLLVAWEGLGPARAAQVVGCSPATFRARLHRGRRHLAAALDEPQRLQRTTAEEAR